MIDIAASALSVSQIWIASAVAIFLRVGACFIVLPGLGSMMIPVRVRLAAALALTVILVPALADQRSVFEQVGLSPSVFMSEALCGLIIGLALRLTLHILSIAGSIAAQSTSLSQIMGGASPDPQPAMGALLVLSGVTLAVLSGLHVELAMGFARSYDILPFGLVPDPHDLGRWGVGKVRDSFALAVSLSAPFLIASALYNVALGVINKAMPQLMVAFVGAPAITWGGLALLFLVVPLALPVWLSAFEAALTAPLSVP